MKTCHRILLSVSFVAMPATAQLAVPTEPSPDSNRETLIAQNLADSGDPRTTVSRWQERSRSQHQTEWFSVRYTTNAGTGKVRAATNSYVELATGLNRPDPNGGWKRASAAFQITATGAEANLAGHRVKLVGNINSAGAVRVEKAGVTMQGHPLCIAYYDPVDGRSELLAELKDATGWLVSSNEIVYSNCFNGIRASIRYRNFRGGVEQDLILHERPAVTPQNLGFSDKTRLELFTEWIGDTPMPQKETRPLQRTRDADLRQQMVEPDFTDTTLTFGALRMPRGKAFSAGEKLARKEVHVGKRFEIIDGRKILIEAVELRSIRTMLDKLPLAPLSGTLTNAALHPLTNAPDAQLAEARTKVLPLRGVRADQKTEHSVRPLPARRLVQARTDSKIQTATAFLDSKPGTAHAELATVAAVPAFVLDWQLVDNTGPSDYTFYSTNTYLVSGIVNLFGATVFEGGTVVKYDEAEEYSVLQIFDPLECRTEQYRPAFFTSIYDNSVGEIISTAAAPNRYYQAMAIGTTGNQLKHLRVSYAVWGIHSFDINLRHSQITHCDTAFAADWGPINVANVLVQDVGDVFSGVEYTATGLHLTANQCGLLTSTYPGYFPDGCSLLLTNSVLADIGGHGTAPVITLNHTAEWQSGGATPSPFQTVGAGSHYLSSSSTYRNLGTPAVDPALKADLARMTTYPPEVLSGSAPANLVLASRPIGDSDVLDYGYHYPILDYAANVLTVENNNSVLLTNGVVIAPLGYQGFLLKGGELISEGKPDRPNRLLPYRLVQEQGTIWAGVAHGSIATIVPYSLAGQIPAKIQCRFTVFDKYDGGFHIWMDGGAGRISKAVFRDCQFLRGTVHMDVGLASGANFEFINNLFESTYAGFYSTPTLSVFNNLFFYSTAEFQRNGTCAWQARDNVFHHSQIWDVGENSPDHSHNVYTDCYYEGPGGTGDQFVPVGIGETVLSSLTFLQGPFGKYYLPSSATQLINQGSRTAASAGLYHYTTSTTAGSKDGIAPPSPYQVDIGLHYVSANSANNPMDTDYDGLPDYFEDTNGDGLFALGDLCAWQLADTDGDGLGDSSDPNPLVINLVPSIGTLNPSKCPLP